MIKPAPAIAWLMAILLTLMITLAEVAHGEEDVAKEDSAAAQAFRDAWWQETGAGALDKALEGYRAAVAAKGSEAVRAQALYRMGLVLQRMGRTDEALAALKRLATDFPGQGELLARAKQRLEEWTAVDLREQFPEWYKRYQYSPEFQAKIIDLVLQLGTRDHNAQLAAKQELLTIGEPAIPALRQHADSANTSLSRYAMELLVDLGQLPPAASAFKNTSWYRDHDFWKLLASADTKTKAAYATAAAANKDKNWLARWVAATLEGPQAVIAELRADDAASGSTLAAVLAPWFEQGAADAAFIGALRSMVLDEAVPANARYTIAEKLQPTFDFDGKEPHPFGLTPDEVVRWARSDQPLVRRSAWNAMAAARVHSQDALDAVTSHVLAHRLDDKERATTSNAIFGILRMRDSLEGSEKAIEALRKLFTEGGTQNIEMRALTPWGPGRPGAPETPIRALAAAAGPVRGKNSSQLVYAYTGYGKALEPAEVQAQLLDWAERAADGGVRRVAMNWAARHATGDARVLTRPLRARGASQAVVQEFFNGLNQGNLLSLDWDVESVTRMVEAAAWHLNWSTKSGTRFFTVAGNAIEVRLPYNQIATLPFMRLIHEGPAVSVFFDAAVENPKRFDGDFWYLLGKGWKDVPENRRLVVDSLEKGWATWSVEQRAVGLDALLRDTTVPIDDEATETLLRGMLRSEGNTPEARAILLEYVAKLSLEDVRRSFDLTDPEAVDRAVALIQRLPATREVYDAFVPSLRPESTVYSWLYSRFRDHDDPALVQDLIARLMAHSRGNVNALGMSLLTKRAQASDLPIWIQALGHRTALVRKTAAERLGRLYNDEAIQALARAVDDPDPDVRDAVLASLARIEKTEKEKERWREFAKKGR